MSLLRNKYRHRAGRENAPIQASLRAQHPHIQQPKRRALRCSVLLGRVDIFGHEKDNGLLDAHGRAHPVGREEMDLTRRRVSSTHAGRGMWWRRSEIFSSGEFAFCVRTTRLGGGRFGTRGSLLSIHSSPFRGCCGFGLRFFRPGVLPVGGHNGQLRSLRDLLRRGIRVWVGGWNRGGLLNTPSSDDVVPPRYICSS